MLILTVSVISIEVIMISAIMITGENNPTLARDTLFSVLMIVLNGMVGLTLILGGLRYGEQRYNLKGASAYLAVIIPLAGLGIILPRYTTSAPGGEPEDDVPGQGGEVPGRASSPPISAHAGSWASVTRLRRHSQRRVSGRRGPPAT